MPARPVALVTGSARRVGRAIALELAGHGFDLAVHCHRSMQEAQATAEQIRLLGARAQVFQADLADEGAARSLIPAIVRDLGQVDAVVNNASSFEYDDATGFNYARLDAQMRGNAAPAIVLAQTLAEHLLHRGAKGCVVNLLDQKLWNPNPDHFSYTLAKAALEAATTMLAMALAPAVRVCGVAPGLTLPSGPMDASEFERAHRMTPLERASTPDDVAQAVRFLLQAPAITGTTLLVDGGQHLRAQSRDVLFLARAPSGGESAPATPS